MIDWANLRDAYGSAERTPELIRAAVASGREFGDEWDEVWGRLCHQGTVYSASYAALPLLTEAARGHEPVGYIASLHLAAAIVASRDGQVTGEPVRQFYAAEVDELRRMAVRGLAFASDDTEFIYGLGALMAFEDGGVWQRSLGHLADGELPIDCPSCHEALLIDLEKEVPTATVWDASKAPTEVAPGEAIPDSVEARLIDLASSHSRLLVTERLPFLFGRIQCPECGEEFDSWSAL